MVAAALVASLAACIPQSAPTGGEAGAVDAATVDVAQVFSANGIAILPFEGGDPVREVSGDAVLALTEWQVENIQGGMRASGSTVALEALDAAALSLQENEFDPVFAPSEVLMAWWGFAESPRADLARSVYPAPALNAGWAVPLFVLTLFEADSLADLGRTDTDIPAAAGTAGGSVALGGRSLAAIDACGVVGQAIDDVNGFLAAAGVPPRVVGTAVDAAYGIIDGLTGGALDHFRKVIGVINMVMTVSSLITPWTVEQKLSADVFQMGLNGKAGDGGVLVFSVTGVAGEPPAAVKSCLSLFGLKDPTSLKGTTFQVVSNEVYFSPLASIAPSWIVVDATPGELRELDENNTATISFTTGMQTIDPKDTEVTTVFQEAFIYLLDIKRSDVGAISQWIRSAVDGAAYASLLGPTLNNLADLIEVAANPLVDVTYVPVSFLVPTKSEGETEGPAGEDSPPVTDEVKEGIGDCLSVTYIETLTGHTVREHTVEDPATYSTISGAPAGVTALDPKQTCIYDLDNGWRLQIVWPYTIWDDGALDLFLVGNTGPAPQNCSRIGGPGLLDAPTDADGAETSSYVVWDGLNLAVMLVTGEGSSAHKDWLATMARDIGWCDRPQLIDWAWDQAN